MNFAAAANDKSSWLSQSSNADIGQPAGAIRFGCGRKSSPPPGRLHWSSSNNPRALS
jgi:hypothetical protein